MVTVDVLKLDFVSPLTQPPVGKIPIDVPFLPAFLDVAVTGILLTFLLRSRADIYSKRFRRVVTRLMIVAWEAAIPPCACAVTALVTYFTLVNVNYWDLTFQAILGKLYVISLFVTLNGRADIDAQRSHFPTFSNIISPTTGPSIRLSNTRPPEFVAARPSGTISFSSVHQTPTSDVETEGSQDDLERGRRWISRTPGSDLKT
ncbi:hypothetical protein HETIRDRAFT_448320 [Heterobasidion irregulare TC 32-1]|uniref:DUF6534 domain-containing protein n=1 Tax=Heterobasidion irregulare (strain TC 32-1) TaxID=747525 RepID=W4KJ36_HETIT|nr:uncharacterized protein HETIRDRAFT_448320 [Heterobasidion irregulare TC 32-1]ETW85086.1 hypothetical protein HETIRDRAFT_448320 [Heterobasidion irregulare TC 32-1]